MVKERNYLSNYEISIIKSLYEQKFTKQDIQFKINLFRYLINKKTINIARIIEITDKNFFPLINKASQEELQIFNNVLLTVILKRNLYLTIKNIN